MIMKVDKEEWPAALANEVWLRIVHIRGCPEVHEDDDDGDHHEKDDGDDYGPHEDDNGDNDY